MEDNLIRIYYIMCSRAPNVYYIGHTIKKLADEVGRGQQLKCTCCGLKGAVLKCMVVECSRTYHYPCACTLSCMWDKVTLYHIQSIIELKQYSLSMHDDRLSSKSVVLSTCQRVFVRRVHCKSKRC